MKFRKIEGNVNHSSLERLDTLPTPKTITVEEWYNDYYVPGIYFDTRYDRRILWALKQILDLHDSGLRNFLINPLIYADVESCYDFAVKNNSIKDIEYFDNILHNHQSLVAPQYLVGPQGLFPNCSVPSKIGCPLLTLEGKNRTIALAILYLNNPQVVGKWKINVCEIESATRPTLSLIYNRLASGVSPNRMMIRIGQWSTTGDFIYNIRDTWRDQSVIRKGFVSDIKNPKVMDLFDLFVTDKAKLSMKDDQLLCYTLKLVTDNNYKDFDESMDLMYSSNSGDIVKCKKVIKLAGEFVKKYYENVDTKGTKNGWKLGQNGYYVVTHFCKLLLDSDHKVYQRKWPEVIEQFHNWFFGMVNGKQGKDFWNDGKGNIRTFKETLTFFTTKQDAMEKVILSLIKNVYQPLCNDDYIKTSTNELLTVEEKTQVWENNPYRRVQGSVEGVEFKDTPEGKKAEKKFGITLDGFGEWEKITLSEALSPDTNGDHIIPRARKGKHEFDNWELTTDIYNSWKSDRIPDYA